MWFLLIACNAPPDVAGPHFSATASRRVRTFEVNCRGGGDFSTIDAALDHARSGDVLMVAPCTYEGSIHFNGRSVQIVSTDGPDQTTIVATPGKPVIKVNDGEDAGTLVQGFTLTGGGGPLERAIEVQFSSLTLRDVVVSGNGGLDILYSNAGHVLVEGATFAADNTPTDGNLVHDRRGMTVLKDSTVHCGAAAVGYQSEHGAAFVDGSTFDCPGHTGVDVYHSDGRVQRTVIDGLLRVENEALEQYERTIVEDDVTFRNTVSVGEVTAVASPVRIEGSIVTGAACGVRSEGSTIAIVRSDLWGNGTDTCGDTASISSEGTFSADPKFRGAGDFHLAAGSPCMDAGPAGAGYADPDGSPNDVGAYGGPLSLGGGW
jgi:hypothetical protein